MQRTATLGNSTLFLGTTEHPVEGLTIIPHKELLSINLVGTPALVIKSDGEFLDGSTIKANQRVEIPLGTYQPRRVIGLAINPVLLSLGQVGLVPFLTPGEKTVLSVYFVANKTTDLASLSYLVRFFVHE